MTVKNIFAVPLHIQQIAISICVSTLISWLIHNQLHNTLNNNGKWESSKQNLEMYVWGRDEYMSGRPALYDNQLSLSAWHGFQEVITKKQYPVSRLDFDFYLDPGAYLYVIFNKTADQFSAIRLSANPDYTNGYFTAAASGKFLSATSFTEPTIARPGWHHAAIYFNTELGMASISIDRRTMGSITCASPEIQQFGFRGSYKNVYIDNVSAYDARGTVVFADEFTYTERNVPRVLATIVSYILYANLAVFLLVTVIFKRKKDPVRILAPVNIWGVILLCIIGVYIRWLYLRYYPNPHSFLNTIVTQVTNPHANEYVRTAEEEYSRSIADMVRLDEREKILFLGSSQTWGAGASTKAETFVRVFDTLANTPISEAYAYAHPATHNVLGESVIANTQYDVIDGGISGSDSTNMLNNYKKVWVDIKPKVVIINLSNNDAMAKTTFRENLFEFARIGKQNGIITVFVLEANSPEVTPGELYLHPVMREVAQRQGIRLVDLHAYLKLKNNTGILWWDFIHPTSYGHELAGQYILNSIKDIIAL